MNKYLIYALSDPRTNEIRYIGRSSNGLSRPKRHSMPYNLLNERNHCRNWVKALVDLNIEPDIDIVEEVPQDCKDINAWLNESEQFYISYFRYIGANLVNQADGGLGVIGYKMSDETKKKLSKVKSGKSLSPLALAAAKRLGERRRGIKRLNIKSMSPDTRMAFVQKRRDYMTGRKLTAEHRKAIGEGNRGKVNSLESRVKVSITKKMQAQVKKVQNSTNIDIIII